MRPHDHHLRAEAVRLCVEDGLSQAAISRKLGVSYDSVRTWVKRYKAHGAKGLLPAYSNCGRSPVFNSRIIERALEYKTRHPEWGTGFIRLKLESAELKINGIAGLSRGFSHVARQTASLPLSLTLYIAWSAFCIRS